MSEQTYIEGTEPLRITDVDAAFEKYLNAKEAVALAREKYNDAREDLQDAMDSHSREITESNGDCVYVTSSGAQSYTLKLRVNKRLSCTRAQQIQEAESDE